jgi:hypothetical protein
VLTRDRTWHAQYTRIIGRRIASLDHFVNGINAAEARLTYVELHRRANIAVEPAKDD